MGSSPKYRRVLLKVSGEALAGGKKHGIDRAVITDMASQVAAAVESGVQCAVVIGAGNFFRGSLGEELGIDRVNGDYMGMLATVMNAIAFKDALIKAGVKAKVMSALNIRGAAEDYNIFAADEFLNSGGVVIASGGTGSPFFTTDTAAGLRAIELGADILLKATRVDGVYTSDPEKDPTAKRYETLKFSEVLEKNLRVMDITSVALCMENKMPIVVFNMFEKGSLAKILSGQNAGTIIS